MVGGIAQYLTEFRLDGSVEVEPLFQPSSPKPTIQEPVDDTADRIRQAEKRGQEEGRSSAQREFELALAAERARHEEHLASERAKWAEQQGTQLADRLTASLHEIETRICESIARIITPFIADALRTQMTESLRELFTSLVFDKQSAAIRVSGPRDVLLALSKRLGDHGPSVEFVPNDATDVSILVGDTMIETQLEAWIGHLAQVLESS
jgi:hypothetical protein